MLLSQISAKRDKKCWFQDKVFFIDINSGNTDYKLTIDILSQHGARTDLFLSKDVLHIVKNYQERRAIENSKIPKSFNNSRAARMIQASLKQKLELGTRKGCLNPALLLSPESIRRMSDECSECTLKEKSVKNLVVVLPQKAKCMCAD